MTATPTGADVPECPTCGAPAGLSCVTADYTRRAPHKARLRAARTVVVCDACLSEACWNGDLLCDEYRTAGTRLVSR